MCNSTDSLHIRKLKTRAYYSCDNCDFGGETKWLEAEGNPYRIVKDLWKICLKYGRANILHANIQGLLLRMGLPDFPDSASIGAFPAEDFTRSTGISLYDIRSEHVLLLPIRPFRNLLCGMMVWDGKKFHTWDPIREPEDIPVVTLGSGPSVTIVDSIHKAIKEIPSIYPLVPSRFRKDRISWFGNFESVQFKGDFPEPAASKPPPLRFHVCDEDLYFDGKLVMNGLLELTPTPDKHLFKTRLRINHDILYPKKLHTRIIRKREHLNTYLAGLRNFYKKTPFLHPWFDNRDICSTLLSLRPLIRRNMYEPETEDTEDQAADSCGDSVQEDQAETVQ